MSFNEKLHSEIWWEVFVAGRKKVRMGVKVESSIRGRMSKVTEFKQPEDSIVYEIAVLPSADRVEVINQLIL